LKVRSDKILKVAPPSYLFITGYVLVSGQVKV